jgi:serine/threonine-protein kinase RsbW
MKALLNVRSPATLENLERLIESVSDCAREQGFDQKRILGIQLATEEALVNISNYSYPEKAGEVEINCKLEKDRFVIEITDSGVPFDMTSLPDPDITADIDDRKVGGLGVFLMKKVMERITYRREENRNILRLAISKSSKT